MILALGLKMSLSISSRCHMNDRYVECRNPDCAKPIPLLCSNLLEIGWFGIDSPPGTGHEILVCPSCDQAYDYTELTVRKFDPRQLLALSQEKALALRVVNFDCEVENCEIRVLLLRPMPAELPSREVGSDSANWKFVDAHCKKGHQITKMP